MNDHVSATLMPAGLALVTLLVVWSIYRFHLNPKNDFNLIDLLIEGGRASKVSYVVMAAFHLHSWVMLDLELHGKMTEGYLTIYGATWVSPLLIRMVATSMKGGESSTTIEKSTIKTTETKGAPDEPRIDTAKDQGAQ